MGRINGENSDYKLVDGQIQPVDPFQTLELRLFICPYNQPNKLEPLDDALGRCTGIVSVCPHVSQKNGHALIHLHQNEGISLVTDNNNQLRLDQNGNIQLNPAAGGEVQIKGKLKLTIGGNNLEVGYNNEVMLQSASGAQVILKQDGSIDITPKSDSTINLKGDVAVTAHIEAAVALPVQGHHSAQR